MGNCTPIRKPKKSLGFTKERELNRKRVHNFLSPEVIQDIKTTSYKPFLKDLQANDGGQKPGGSWNSLSSFASHEGCSPDSGA